MSIWSGLWYRDTFERVLGTAAQTLLALLSVDGLDLVNLDLTATASAVGIASALVVLKAIVAATLYKDKAAMSPASLAGSGVK